jgi:uroporphyrinogen-III synthase
LSDVLAGCRIAIPETREIEVLAEMLERHGAVTVRCPLVSIHDVADAAPVEAWLRRFIDDIPDDLILLTGEGLFRLVGFAERAGLAAEFLAALGETRKITRGPKPARRLRTLGLKPDLAAAQPTTEGIIAALTGEALTGRRIAVQFYPDNPDDALLDFLNRAGAEPDPILCYVYGSQSDDARVVEVIREMAAGRIDLITFTSSPQLRRLRQVADQHDCDDALREGLRRTTIAAVGPVVARAIEELGAKVAILPRENFHLKPMVNEIIAAIGKAAHAQGG